MTDEQKREKQREYMRRWYAKKKAQQANGGSASGRSRAKNVSDPVDSPEPATALDRKCIEKINARRKDRGLPPLNADGFQTVEK